MTLRCDEELRLAVVEEDALDQPEQWVQTDRSLEAMRGGHDEKKEPVSYPLLLPNGAME